MCVKIDSLLISPHLPSNCIVTYTTLPEAAESLRLAFSFSQELFPAPLPPRPPCPVLSVSRAQWPCASCTFTRPNDSTAVIQPAGLQDSGAMFLLLVLLTGLDGLHAGQSKSRYFPPS